MTTAFSRSTTASSAVGSRAAPSTRRRAWTHRWPSSASGSPPQSQWPALWKAAIVKDDPNVVMILAGRWEVSNRTYDGHWTNIENPAYAAYVPARAHRRGPPGRIRRSRGRPADGSRATTRASSPTAQPWPEDSRTRLAIYNRIVRDVASSIPGTSLLDFNAMACPGGQYEEFMDGQQVRLADGIHFTFTGGDVFASRIWPFVLRLGHQQMARAGSR